MIKPSYQLTPYRIGSVKEMWSVSWPLILALLSTSLTLFIDKMLLARVSLSAMNATVNAWTAIWTIMYLPFSIAGISDVLVGRYHGEGLLKKCGQAAWQMIWFAALIGPFMLGTGSLLTTFLFNGTGNEELETQYFTTLIMFSPVYCFVSALTGFFIGIGKVRIVTIATLIANLFNIILDILLIFGFEGFPSLGVKGAAFAAGSAQVIQLIFLSSIFFHSAFRKLYDTTNCAFDLDMLFQGLKIGVPTGCNSVFEMASQLVFYRIIILSGQTNFSIVVLCRSFYDLLSFFTEGLYRGIVAIASNLIGGYQLSCIGKVMRSAVFVYLSFFGLLTLFCLTCPDSFLEGLLSEEDRSYFLDHQLFQMTKRACFWIGVAYLLDGFSWIILAQLVAAGDARFVLYSGTFLNWVVYIVPVYAMVKWTHSDADMALMTTVLYSVTMVSVYFWRYYSGGWMKNCSMQLQEQFESIPVIDNSSTEVSTVRP